MRGKFIARIKFLAIAISFGVIVIQAQASTYSPQHEKVKTQFVGDEEPTAKDALWSAEDVFKVGVLDNGQNRDGYAGYVCQVLVDKGFKGRGVLVRVIDIKKLALTGEWVNLGTALCN